MYQEFIVDFEARLDPLSLVQIAQTVMERFTDPVEAIAFIDKIQEKTKMNKEAFVLCRVLVGKVKLRRILASAPKRGVTLFVEKTLPTLSAARVYT